MLRPKTPADLERTRARIPWVDDEDLGEIESKSRAGAALLGFFTWGGGRIYLGDLRSGIGLVIGLLAAIAALPASIGPIVYTAVGAIAAAWSYQGARAVDRFVATRDELRLRAGPDPAAYRLLAAAAAVDPSLPVPVVAQPAPPAGPHAELIDRLRKLAALRRAGVLHETELRDRKIDLLSAAAPPTRAELDELLFALLPLGHEGVLTPDDFDFLKTLGGSQ